MAIKINSKLKTETLKKDFQAKGRIQIADFLDSKNADSLHDMVAGCQLYKFKYNDGDEEIWIDPVKLKNFPEPKLQEMGNTIFTNAMNRDFQYNYYACPLTEEKLSSKEALAPFKEVMAFLNSADMKAFIKALSGDSFKDASAEAIWHKTDSFQTTGEGTRKGEKRLFGFALDLSRDWDVDWGGNRFFREENGEIADLFPSLFNSLTLFRVPQKQSLSMITGYSKGLRLSISGWLLG